MYKSVFKITVIIFSSKNYYEEEDPCKQIINQEILLTDYGMIELIVKDNLQHFTVDMMELMA